MNINTFWRLFLPVLAILVVGLAIIGWQVPVSIRDNAEQAAIDTAKNTVNQYKALRKYYVKNVMEKVLASSEIKGSINHRTEKNSIPLPATMIHDLSEIVSKQGSKISLYSAYPFPNRKERKLDSFASDAWTTLVQAPDSAFSRTEVINGIPTVRVAIADKMVSEACVNCHNNHLKTPKNDWKLGDVRGVLEVSIPITGQLAAGQILGEKLLLLVALLGLVILVSLWLLFNRLVIRPIGGEPEMIATIAQRIAEGDLTIEFDKNKTSGIYAVMRGMSRKLTEVVSAVQQVTDNVASGSDEVSVASQHLSKSSTEQAASLEEISSSMEQMAANIRQSADNAGQTEQIAQKAATDAQQSGMAVTEAVSAMKNITDKISIIEEISRQT
ncbi:MAG: DUF3365 domain-containing protein, partial [Gammaproteobacteria bacterium]|nr:DUF3365 domain-containing protein [Gammaproteobacteria bacterium]